MGPFPSSFCTDVSSYMQFKCVIVIFNSPIARVFGTAIASSRTDNSVVYKYIVCSVVSPVSPKRFSGSVTVWIIAGLLLVERSVLLLRSMVLMKVVVVSSTSIFAVVSVDIVLVS